MQKLSTNTNNLKVSLSPPQEQEWLHNENEKRVQESFYSSRARVGLTGFIFDCIAGKQEEEVDYIGDIESGTAFDNTLASDVSVKKIKEEPITFALASSTQMIAAAVGTITSTISNFFSAWNPYSKPQEEKQLIHTAVQSDLFEVIIQGEMETTIQNIQRSYSLQKVQEFHEISSIRVESFAAPTAIESPTMNDISAFNVSESKMDHQLVEDSVEEDLTVDSADLWYKGPSEDDEDYYDKSLSNSFYAMESYIDSTQDDKIDFKPLPKRNVVKKTGVRVHFEPMVELMDAVVTNDKEAVKKVIKEGQININDRDKLGYTMLHYAASRNHVDLIKYLIEKGADINCIDLADWTPLHLAAIADNYKACKVLLELGANFEYPNDEGNIPIDLTEDAKLKKLLADATKKKLVTKKLRAIYNWTADTPEYLSIKKSEQLKVLNRENQMYWLVQNEHSKQIGLVPRIFIQ